MTVGSEEPAWKQRAVERSLRGAKERAGQRVQKFLDAAQEIIVEKGSTDFTVQEVVERSKQSLRSFYLQFDGKHELLLALYEEAVVRMTAQIRAATENEDDPVEQLRVAVELLYELCQPDPVARRPLFTEFGTQLLISHPVEMRTAYTSLFGLFTELLERAGQAGRLRGDADPRRVASMMMQSIMFIAQPASADMLPTPITAEEVWDFCAHGVAR
ncbi:TetR family transcriptional regulator [Gordonia sp. HNM0687]|uniref:TetR family transcriptional regulator n=1 Tax=Gordonia mangrovi TaxID=2665643 RepID=A0A6L7GXD6_9ACTN|nr:TetR/AcrR family transcriptional regulator [Gordonia mangrovi]MXP23295.1 TetR family transcriptional regulator [Gordonia mangrovi]UVF76789.1 TetR/AcrR family transcriptional regulator [Gordonia mangrovi]